MQRIETQTKVNMDCCVSPSPLSLRQNFSWTVSGNVIYAGCQWGILAILAKLCPPETVGVFALALALATPVMMLLDLQLRSVQATDSKGEYRFGEYLGLRLITTAVGFGVIAVLAFGGGHHGSTTCHFWVWPFLSALRHSARVCEGLFQQTERMDLIAKSLIIKGTLVLALATAGLLLTHVLIGAVIGMCLGYILVLTFYDIPCCSMLLKDNRAYRPIWSSGRLWQLAWLALPLGIVRMLGSLSGNLPRYFIESYRGPAELEFLQPWQRLSLLARLWPMRWGYRLCRAWRATSPTGITEVFGSSSPAWWG